MFERKGWIMVLEFLSNPSTTDILMLTVLFLLFVMSIKKMMNLITNLIMVSVAAVLIPILLSRFTGLPIPTDSGSLVMYVGAGVLAYFVYTAGRYVMKGARAVGKVGKIIPKRSKKKVIVEKRIVEERPPAAKKTVQPKRRTEAETFKDYVILDEKPRKVSGEKAEKPTPYIEKLPGRKKKEKAG